MHKNAALPSFLRQCLLFALTSFLFLTAAVIPSFAAQTDIVGPAGSGAFGTSVTVLPNGNFVVTDPSYDEGGVNNIGAVYLYNGNSLTIISTLKGSTLDDQIGSSGITVLTNGNYLVRSVLWDNGAATSAGAVTWCSATTGCNGVVSAANSIVGGSSTDNVANAVALTNGNYVVFASFWDNPVGPLTDVGAAIWGDGISGTAGVISPSNSLVGSSSSDRVSSGGVIALTNGNYVVRSALWDQPVGPVTDVGAVTFGNGSGGTVGLVTIANSLVGGSSGDQIGSSSLVRLSNGNYVVGSASWDSPIGPLANVGAATWGDGVTGTIGLVSAANSLVGGTANDSVANFGITPLTNGNYVVQSVSWDNPGVMGDVGAATWCDGATGRVGLVTAANSLIGSSFSDQVGPAVRALSNGNYVVISTAWMNPASSIGAAGAVTWGDGTTGIVGVVSSSNSLVGTSTQDQVGLNTVALSNGNYVVGTSTWDDPSGPFVDAGAATWGNGNGGTVGTISSANSLVGGRASDQVSSSGISVLTNGNYVVRSPNWDNPSPLTVDAGAATWGNGTTGSVGLVRNARTLRGFRASDQVGLTGVTALTNGNYVVVSRLWDNTATFPDAGAVTWGNGTIGSSGFLSPDNSLIGGASNDQLGSGGVGATNNGNYVVSSPLWDNPVGPVVDAGARTLGNGTVGTTGILGRSNTIAGTVTTGISGASYDNLTGRLFGARGASNTVSILGYSCNQTVTNTNDSGPGSLRDAIDFGCDGDTITFSPTLTGTITLTSGEIATNKTLTIQGPTSSAVSISGNSASRIIGMSAAVSTRTLSISNLTFTGGNGVSYSASGTGGAIAARGSLNLTSVRFVNNTASNAAGAVRTGGSTTITNCLFDGNSARISGGAIGAYGGNVSISGSTISNNVVSDGSFGGGAIDHIGGLMDIVNSTISGNTVLSPSQPAEFAAGAITTYGGLTITNTTITKNSAPSGTDTAAAIVDWGSASTVSVQNSIIAGNLNNSTMADVHSFDGPASFVSSGYNIIGNVGSMTGFTATGDQTGTGMAPLDPKLAPLGSYGGLTQTHALLAGSPAIDPASSNGAPATDQRGASRVGNADIGAFELNNSGNGGTYLASLPIGRQSVAYDVPITANSGAFTYSITAGALPMGLSLTTTFAPNAVVAITGTPSEFGTFDFTVTATDGANTNVTNYRLLVFGPSAAGVSISGRVLTADGRGLRNAVVNLTDTNGAVRRFRTSSFGYYRFDDIPSGATYVIAVASKQYQFTPRTLNVGGDLTEIDLVGW